MDPKTSSVSILGNRYQLLSTLGTGGMATVYQARDSILERTVAIKVLRQDFSDDEAFRQRFLQEAKAAANLTHPNIVTVHDLILSGGRFYIVMEFVPGTDLKTLIKQRGSLTVEEALYIMIQVCAGVGYAHRSKIVHCDLKPQNILVTPDLRAKVADFGIARALASIQPDERHDVVWGSPQYFSPEQASGLPPSRASDVYSLGIILFELLTGQLPFTSNDPAQLVEMHRTYPPPSARTLNPAIPQELDQILLKVMSKEPSQRYRTADQLGHLLNDLYSSLIASPQAPEMPAQSTIQPAIPPKASLQQPVYSQPEIQPEAIMERAPIEINWGLIGLGLVTFLAVGGLIPFWLYIWLTISAPVR
jgi:eukaryotic-like serine/threonine-protein kinase